jgi:hypothetical protein
LAVSADLAEEKASRSVDVSMEVRRKTLMRKERFGVGFRASSI